MPKTAIIIVVNPMPRLYVKDLVAALHRDADVKLLAFYGGELFTPEDRSVLAAMGVEVVQHTYRGRLSYVGLLRRAARTLRAWLAVSGGIDVFVCQPNHLLTNFPVFSAQRRRPMDVVPHLIPDGVANFYVTDTQPYRRTMKAKRLVGWMIGLPFRPYDSNYLALGEAEYGSYRYLGSPGIAAGVVPCEELQVQAPQPEESVDRWLFLGQPSLGREVDEVYAQCLEVVRQMSVGRLDYKPHPAERADAARSSLLRSLGLTLVNDTAPGEVVAARYQHVAGVASSVLFNVRLLGWGESVWMVTDEARLAKLTGRSTDELRPLLETARSLGVRSIPSAAPNREAFGEKR